MPLKLFSRLFGNDDEPREAIRPLWHRVVEVAREKRWYGEMGVADTLDGRFDMITAVLALVLLRMEGDANLAAPSVYLTELFVEDMDGQLRESGVGDVVVGKHIGRLMSAVGGRLGAYREGLAQDDDKVLAAAVARNLSLIEGTAPETAAAGLRALYRKLSETSDNQLMAGEI